MLSIDGCMAVHIARATVYSAPNFAYAAQLRWACGFAISSCGAVLLKGQALTMQRGRQRGKGGWGKGSRSWASRPRTTTLGHGSSKIRAPKIKCGILPSCLGRQPHISMWHASSMRAPSKACQLALLAAAFVVAVQGVRLGNRAAGFLPLRGAHSLVPAPARQSEQVEGARSRSCVLGGPSRL